MDFAPYQDQSPETGRTLSPPPRRSDSQSPTPGPPPPRSSKSPNNRPSTDPFGAAALPAPSYFGNGGAGGNHHDSSSGNGLGGNAAGFEGSRAHINQFETSLPMRLDYEAMLAYLLLPPAGGVFLLLVEHKSDYVRFHAWQSSLLFTAVFVIHIIFVWSSVLSWMLFVGDLILIGWLTMHAYRDADTLDRNEVPYFGSMASSFLDEE